MALMSTCKTLAVQALASYQRVVVQVLESKHWACAGNMLYHVKHRLNRYLPLLSMLSYSLDSIGYSAYAQHYIGIDRALFYYNRALIMPV
jgi:hypothetical protein